MIYTLILGAFLKIFKNIRWRLSESESGQEKIGNEFKNSKIQREFRHADITSSSVIMKWRADSRQQTAAEQEEQEGEEEAFIFIFKFFQERVGTAGCTLLKNLLFR